MNTRPEINIILIGDTKEKNHFINTCGLGIPMFSHYDDERDYSISYLKNFKYQFNIGSAYDCCKPEYLANKILHADAVIYLPSATPEEIAGLKK